MVYAGFQRSESHPPSGEDNVLATVITSNSAPQTLAVAPIASTTMNGRMNQLTNVDTMARMDTANAAARARFLNIERSSAGRSTRRSIATNATNASAATAPSAGTCG